MDSMRAITAEHDAKKSITEAELADQNLNEQKYDKNHASFTMVAVSTTTLVSKSGADDTEYDPFEHRNLRHATTDFETLVHLMKGSLGSGILSMPLAFLNAGLLCGLIATCVVGVICTYCVQTLVKCSHILCKRSKVPTLSFSETAKTAFLMGPPILHKFSGFAAGCINTLLVIDLLGCCCVYNVFVGRNIQQVMPLANKMKTPTHFVGCPGVLNIGMMIVVALYVSLGFFGYLKYGSTTEANITLNLPTTEVLAQLVKIKIAVAIFFTYALQFYVPFEVIWNASKHYFGSYRLLAEYALRTVLVLCTVGVAAAVPNIGPFISLVGAVSLSTMGIIFPAIIELATFWDSPGLGTCYWHLWKNILIIMFGVLGFATGTWSSLREIIEQT
ncbi:proton-coupled amino acid transporter-like protein pathetic isoform X2 [Schistocerca nitens]|uniref:proton-coupled amino acid transporter-like protein pathetic isoform X2 n=1 Tax=Schistocerca nitens TaxID=7011 RepID=UPI0021190B5A|nr:proton-coupled amino acid transporter-like protein pathetic isoform X2 [Schistocerca nitens]